MCSVEMGVGEDKHFSMAVEASARTFPLDYEPCLDMVSLEVVPYKVVSPIHVATVFGNTARKKVPRGLAAQAGG